MKKCPYCGAAIEENARFCLYCMRELEEKAVMETKAPFWTKQKIRLILICAAAALLLVVILLLVSRCTRSEQTGEPGGSSPDAAKTQTDPPGDILAESTATIPEETPGETAVTGATAGTDETAGPGTANSGAVTNTAAPGSAAPSAGNTSSAGNPSGTDNTPAPPTASGTATPAAGNTPTPPTAPGTATPGAGSTPTPSTAPSTATPAPSTSPGTQTPSEAVYTYRDATLYDLPYLPYNTASELLAQGAVIITGVEKAPENGIYIIPERLDGKAVVEVQQYVFDDYWIRSTVKKVFFPASIYRVANAFQNCENLIDLYFAGDFIYVDSGALSRISGKQQLTIHGAPDCICYYDTNKTDTLKGRAAYYGIAFQSWDGAI